MPGHSCLSPQILGGFSQPHTASQIPHKGERAAEMAAGAEKMHLSHGLSPFCIAPGPDAFLVPQCPQSCLCLFLGPPQIFAELIVQYVTDKSWAPFTVVHRDSATCEPARSVQWT